MEFLFSLGWPISVSRNSGWNGNVKTSWKGLDMSRKEGLSELAKSNEKRNGAFSSDSSGGSLFNGETQILHWADVTSEIAFLVPSRKSEAGLTKAVWNVQGKHSHFFHLKSNACFSYFPVMKTGMKERDGTRVKCL